MSVHDYMPLIDAYAAQNGIPASLVAGIMQQESGGNPNAVNNTGGDAARGGSYGLMQVSLETAQEYGYAGDGAGLLDPETNISIATEFLGDLYRQYGGDVNDTIAAYNAGSPRHLEGDPSQPYTNQAYVNDVLGFMQQYGGPAIAFLMLLGALVWFLTRKGA